MCWYLARSYQLKSEVWWAPPKRVNEQAYKQAFPSVQQQISIESPKWRLVPPKYDGADRGKQNRYCWYHQCIWLAKHYMRLLRMYSSTFFLWFLQLSVSKLQKFSYHSLLLLSIKNRMDLELSCQKAVQSLLLVVIFWYFDILWATYSPMFDFSPKSDWKQ